MSQTFTLQPGHRYRDTVRDNVIKAVMALPVDKAHTVEIKEYRKPRSDAQLGALFGVAYKAIMEASGLQGDDDKRDLHRNMCGDFFGWTEAGMGRRRPVRTTTTDENGKRDVISTKVQAEMYDFIQRQAAEYGIYVPDPNPLHFTQEQP